jgi:hypothetical protein
MYGRDEACFETRQTLPYSNVPEDPSCHPTPEGSPIWPDNSIHFYFYSTVYFARFVVAIMMWDVEYITAYCRSIVDYLLCHAYLAFRLQK